jgi:succinate dehydrogenase/fumarate reductase flavoprotein subunit
MMEADYIKKKVDIVVIGGGASGALAAITAKRSGASVAFITKESQLVGGATVMAGGGTSLPLSPGDNGSVFFGDIMKSGQYLNNPKLVHLVADNAMEAFYNLENCDFLLDRKDLKHEGVDSMRTVKQGEGHSYPRAYLDRREALGFCHGIAKTVMRNEIEIHTETVALRFLKKNGAVCGVTAYNIITGEFIVFSCKAVILAAGGLGALYEETTNSTVLTGDGYAMAYEAGAEMMDMEMVQFMPLTFPYPKIRRGKIVGMCSLLGPDVKLYNGLGERYMHKYDPVRKEFTTRDIGARANFTEIKEGRGTANNAIVVDNRDFKPEILNRWKATNPFRYRQCVQVYGEEAGNWKKPFEAIPSQHFFMGGVRIDEHLAASVPGLYAVGEVTGGVHGANRLSGVAFAEILALGPIAGREAFAFASNREFDEPAEEEIAAQVREIREPLLREGTGLGLIPSSSVSRRPCLPVWALSAAAKT